MRTRSCLIVILVCFLNGSGSALAQTPIPVAPLKRKESVSFAKEVLPILRRNCLACHSASEANGELVLESPQSILKGGDNGPAIVRGKGAQSLLLKVAAHQVEPLMPPPENDVAAQSLTPQELGLIQLWIDQGAKGAETGALLSPKDWRPLPPGAKSIYAVAVSPDGQYAACGRANQIFIYHVPTGHLVTRLTDARLQAASSDQRPGIAHLDVIHTLTFNSQGDMLASGGFRTVKLWRRPSNVQRAHWTAAASLRAVAVSPDRRQVAISGSDHAISVWSLDKPQPELTLKGHQGEIRGLCFSRDGRWIISGSVDQSIRVWNAADGSLTGRIDTAAAVHSVTTLQLPPQASPSGNGDVNARPAPWIASGGADRLVHVWRLPTRLPRPIADAPAKATAVTSSRDGQWLAMATAEGLVRVVHAQTNKLLRQWQAHPGAIHDLSLHVVTPPKTAQTAKAPQASGAETSPSDLQPLVRLASAGEDGSVRWWNVEQGQQLAIFRGAASPVRRVRVLADGKRILSGSADGSVSVWSLDEVPSPPFTQDSPTSGAVVSPDGKLLAASSVLDDRPAIVIREFTSGRVLHTLLGHESSVVALAFSHDNLKLVSGSADKTARVWDLRNSKSPQVSRFDGHNGSVTAVAFNRDASQVVSGSADNGVKLWKTDTAEEVANFAGHTGPVVGVWMDSGNRPVSASVDKTVRFWNPVNGQPARTTTEPVAISAFAASRDNARIAVALANGQIKLYQVNNGAVQLTLEGHKKAVQRLAFSADGGRLVSAGDDHQAIVWDLSDGRTLERFLVDELTRTPVDSKSPAPVARLTSAVFGPSSDRIVLTDRTGRLTVQPLQFAGALRGIAKSITGLVDHPNGQTVLVAGEDGSCRGFNLTNYQTTFTASHGAAVHDLAISADGQRMATAGEDKRVRIWNPANGAALQPAQLTGFAGPVHSVGFSSDGARVFAGSGNGNTGQLLVFELKAPNGILEQKIQGHTNPVEACVPVGSQGDGVSLSSDGILLQWSLQAIRHIPGHSQPITSVSALTPSGQPPQVVSGSLDGTMRRWNALTGQQLAQLNHGGPIESIAVRDDGSRLASASSNNSVRLWNTANNQQLAEMRGDLRARNLVAQLTRQKTDATVKVAAAKTALGAVEKQLPIKTAAEKKAADALAAAKKDAVAKTTVAQTTSAAKATAEKLAIEAAAVAQKAATQLDAAKQRALDLAAQAQRLADTANRAKSAASTNPENTALAQAATAATALASKAAAEAKAAMTAQAAPTKSAADTAKAAADLAQKALATNKPFSDAAAALATAEKTQRAAEQAQAVAARDLKLATAAVPQAKAVLTENEAELKRIDGLLAAAVEAEKAAQQPVRALAFSPDGRTLASGGDFGVVHTWGAEDGKPISSFVGHQAAVKAVAFVSDDQLVSTSDDQGAVIWDANPQWQLERVIGDVADPDTFVDRVVSVDFNPAGTLLATGGGVPSRGGEVKLYNVSDGSLLRQLVEPHTDAVNCVAFSPDGRFVASAAADKYAKSFEVATGKQVAQFEGHTNHALGVSWRAGGKFLATCGADSTIRIWNAETGDRIRVIQGFNKQVTSVKFIGQTQFVVSTAGDPIVRKHNTDNGGVQTNFAGCQDYMYSIDATVDPTNGIVVAGGHDGVLRIWRSGGPVVHVIGPPDPVGSPATADDK